MPSCIPASFSRKRAS